MSFSAGSTLRIVSTGLPRDGRFALDTHPSVHRPPVVVRAGTARVFAESGRLGRAGGNT